MTVIRYSEFKISDLTQWFWHGQEVKNVKRLRTDRQLNKKKQEDEEPNILMPDKK